MVVVSFVKHFLGWQLLLSGDGGRICGYSSGGGGGVTVF